MACEIPKNMTVKSHELKPVCMSWCGTNIPPSPGDLGWAGYWLLSRSWTTLGSTRSFAGFGPISLWDLNTSKAVSELPLSEA